MKKVNIIFLVCVLLIGFALPSSASAATTSPTEKQPSTKSLHIETPEFYTIDVYSDSPNEQDLFEKIGTKDVTALTTVNKVNDIAEISIYTKEDYYNLEHQYLYTEIGIDEIQNNYSNGLAKERNILKKINKQQAQVLQGKIDRIKNVDEKQKSKTIKEIIKNELPEFEVTSFKDSFGVSYNSIDNQTTNLSLISVAAFTEAHGAFNNYYNRTDDTFTAQVLGAAQYRYIKVTGSVSLNSTGYSKFKGYINQYESDVINAMSYGSYPYEVGNWTYKIASYVGYFTTAAGLVLKGPDGWALGLTYLSRATMLTKFAGWTTMAYATYGRMDYSIDAARQQYNAQKMMNATYWPNVTWSFPVIY